MKHEYQLNLLRELAGIDNNLDYSDWVSRHVVGEASRAFYDAGGENDHSGLIGNPYTRCCEIYFYRDLGFYCLEDLKYEDIDDSLKAYLIYKVMEDNYTSHEDSHTAKLMEELASVGDLSKDCHDREGEVWDKLIPILEYKLAEYDQDDYFDGSEHIREENIQSYVERMRNFSPPAHLQYKFVTSYFAEQVASTCPEVYLYWDVFQSGLCIWARDTSGQSVKRDAEVILAYFNSCSETEQNKLKQTNGRNTK